MKELRGKNLAAHIVSVIQKELEGSAHKPGLALILVGDDHASKTYVSMKKKRCEEAFFHSEDYELPNTTTHQDLEKLILTLNRDENIDGILLQMPLPTHLDNRYFQNLIDPQKDVDGFHPLNIGKLLLGDFSGFIPCTPYGIYLLMRAHGIETEGKHIVIIGRGNIVGKPLAALLMQNIPGGNATVTIANSYTENLEKICQSGDILIAALGKAHFVQKSFVKDGTIVIDVGINRLIDNQLVGDVDFDNVASLCEWITPVPGGVGPMTIAMLLFNTFMSYMKKKEPSPIGLDSKVPAPRFFTFQNGLLKIGAEYTF